MMKSQSFRWISFALLALTAACSPDSTAQSQTSLVVDGEDACHDPCEPGAALDVSCNREVVAPVRAIDPLCCEESWDATCVDRAFAAGACGEPDAPRTCSFDPCVVGDSPGRTCDHTVVQAVCESDPYCCAEGGVYDATCVAA
ncbi:MAG: hypothetical protein AAGA56_17970, partial [Myxococcota bacterium]